MKWKRLLLRTFLMKFIVGFILTTSISGCLVQKQSDTLNSRLNKITIQKSDSIQIDQVYLSFFGIDQIDTINQNFEQIHYAGERVNILIQGKRLYKSGYRGEISSLISNFVVDKEGGTIKLDLDNKLASIKHHSVEDMVTADYPRTNIIINNNTENYIFRMVILSENFEGNKWEYTYMSRYNNIDKVLKPNSEDHFRGVIYPSIKNVIITFGVYDPRTQELKEIVVDDFEVSKNILTIVLDE